MVVKLEWRQTLLEILTYLTRFKIFFCKIKLIKKKDLLNLTHTKKILTRSEMLEN